ncbi:MAG: dihydropteroate synthase [Chlamydiales bacterium]|nr:dihydropteroate synthase [Chlamydiales bacterium]
MSSSVETPEENKTKSIPTRRNSLLMGVLNVTPDSFYDGGSYYHLGDAVSRAIELEIDGADIIDIGGESTRPNASPVPEDEEFARVIPVIKQLTGKVNIPISVDTTRPSVAKEALKAGASIINDVSGLKSQQMQKIAADYQATVCVMHRQGSPQTMQDNPVYKSGVTSHLMSWFDNKISQLVKSGISEDKIIIDPGIGFGKTVEHNLEILKNISKFKSFGLRVLVGISRKSFLSAITGKPSQHLLAPTLALDALLYQAEVDIIRVHDVYEHKLMLEVLAAYNRL